MIETPFPVCQESEIGTNLAVQPRCSFDYILDIQMTSLKVPGVIIRMVFLRSLNLWNLKFNYILLQPHYVNNLCGHVSRSIHESVIFL